MPQQKIGKYEVRERIGRGGMGMIFKAHDPVLNRAVALKVISTDIEVTDELRARFFREAQACARLSHPNIVTVYDMGEDDGRLFIVMEFLEGEELRHVIAQRKALALEDKLAIMVQVCDGLHYAHQMGIVHRDVKPGNVMLLRNGHVKLLDFGIAQIAAAESDLTRTGLIMGTIRYISPEQVRGRADHRSDIFSVGAVFYEFLSFRVPFTGADPMQILEQLRTEDPPPLTGLDPTIPPELAAIVERAMRKDPAERFPDLAKMRAELEVVQRGLAEAVQRVRGRVRGQLVQIRELRAALSERIGRPTDEAAIPVLDERGRLGAMQALERESASAIDALRAKIARADSFAPALQRGTELLEAGQFADAIIEFEAIVADMPEHARALDALEQARGRAEEQRRQQLAADLLRNARAALDEGGYALCLEILKQAAEVPPSAEVAQEIDRLRQAAGEARLRERVRAQEAGDRAAQGQRSAAAAEAERHAPALWNEAAAKSAEAQAALAQERYAKAAETFDAATALYHQAENQAREARRRLRERARAEEAGGRAAQSQRSAAAADAERHVSALWNEAAAKSAEAQAALAQEQYAQAAETFDAATALYGQAENQAREARRRLRERARAEEAGGRAAQGQRSAAAADAERHAPTVWNEASAKSAEAQAALAQEQYAKAAETFEAAASLYHQAENQARETRRGQRDQVEQARLTLAERRRSALAADATSHAPSEWSEAEASAASAEAAFAREAYTEAGRAFEQGVALYGRAEERAREAIRALEIARADAEKGRQAAALAWRAATQAHAAKYAPESLKAGESTEAQANAAFSRREYASASSAFAEARRQFTAAGQMASVAADAEARRVDAMMSDARRLLESGDAAACLRQLAAVVVLRPGHPAAEELRQKAEERLRQIEAAARSADPTDTTIIVPAVAAEPPTELVRTPPAPLVVAEPPTELVRTPPAPLVVAESQARYQAIPSVEPAREIPDARVLEPAISRDAPALAGGAATSPFSPAPGVGDIGLRRDRTRAHELPGASRRWPWRRGTNAAAMIVGGVAAVVIAASALVIFFWPSGGPPLVSPPGPQTSVPRPVAPPVAPAAPQAPVAPTSVPRPVPQLPGPPAARTAAEALRKQAMAAREEAARADTERLAPSEFAAATQKMREGDAALGQQDMAGAQQRYREALEGYGLAKAEANRTAALARSLTETRAVASQAAEARRAAELVDAPRRAPALWARASSAQGKAEEALRQGAFTQAQGLFTEAEKAYRAAQTAVVERIAAVDRATAEKAAADRAASEKAAADRAAERARAASERERQPRIAAADRAAAEKAAADRAATEKAAADRAAERDRAAAEREQKAGERERQLQQRQLALLRSTAEDERARALIRRTQASAVEASRFAKDLFDAGEAKLTAGDGQARSQDFTAAKSAYQDAADRYMEAEHRAKSVHDAKTQADSAKARMLAEKERANQSAPEFLAAVFEERQANSLYDRLAYKDAAEKFRAAETLFAKASSRPAPPPPPAPSQPGRPRPMPSPF
jgi:predicted Ser/Thr protein kinase